MSLPTGTITFLFTDIEGSTKLWETQPDAMQVALERHDVLMRNAIETNGGTVFKTVGDAFCAAFTTAPQALEAALFAQQSLHQVQAGVGGDLLKVRMALHTGTAERRNEDYFGQPLNRVARLLAAGHGGLILLSQATYILVRDRLPKHASLSDMGEHRLKDLQQPEHVFKLNHPALPSTFPPLNSLDYLPTNLAQQLTSFIGREKEMLEIKDMLQRSRLVTLTGSGGTGKTRLAVQASAEVLDQYSGGVWLVELAPIADPSLVPQAVALALSIREAPGEPMTQTLLSALKAKQILLVLDNCDHLLDSSARLVDSLLKSCPNVRVLVSSREGLGVSGEQTYRVPSLTLPDANETATADTISQYEAVRLFVERAILSKSDFAVTNHNAPALASACRRLDGIPLAIELAAARVRSLSVEEINSRLDQRFRLLTGGSRTALPRQQTLRAMIDWSYDLLNSQEKLLMHRLSVFAGGWMLAAAEKVCESEDIEDWEVLDLLTSLVDKSLAMYELREGDARYRLLETVRQYGRDRLVESGESEVVRNRHLDYFLALAEEAEPKLRGPEQVWWLNRLETEHENLRAALEWNLLGRDGETTLREHFDLRLVVALWRFWEVRGHLTEGRQRLAGALAGDPDSRDGPRSKALNGAGVLAYHQGDYATARALYEESLAIRRELGDKWAIANVLNNLANVVSDQGDYAAARPLYEESLTLQRQLGNRQGIANSLVSLGGVVHDQGDYEAARPLLEESLTIQRELGDKRCMALSLINLGLVAHSQGDYAAARTLLEESLTIQRELGNKRGMASSLINLGLVAHSQGDYAAARTLYEKSLTIGRELGDKWGIASSLTRLGTAAYKQGEYAAGRTLDEESRTIQRELGAVPGIADSLEAFAARAAVQEAPGLAATLWGAADALREVIGSPLPPSETEQYDSDASGAKQAMGVEAFMAAWERGRAMTMDEAIELALGR